MVSQFPAILVGGPPHSGKSVLVYSLTRALRERDVPHYALRACPDGEGDWSNETDRATVRSIRRKGEFNETFDERVAGYLRARHLPLLVDVGGRPTARQAAVFGLCTGAILLVGDRSDEPAAYRRDRQAWLQLLNDAGLPLLADLRSDLHGKDLLKESAPTIRGTVAGLERGQTARGPVFAALVDRLADLFAGAVITTAFHQATSPTGAKFIDLKLEARLLGSADDRWRPEQLPALLGKIRPDEDVALYGRAPNWVYAAATLQARQAWLFDVRYGWMGLPSLPLVDELTEAEPQTGWGMRIEAQDEYTHVELSTGSQYLDPDEPEGLPLPVLTGRPEQGLVMSGKLPYWLLMTAVRRLGTGWGWVAVYQPPLGGAVVVRSDGRQHAVGAIISVK